MIIQEDNCERYETIPYLKNSLEDPDIILYPELVKKDDIKQIIELLKSVKLDNNQGWFTDDPHIFNKKIYSQTFPYFIEQIRSFIEEKTGMFFNACLISNTWDYKKYDWINYDFIPSLCLCESMKIHMIHKKEKKRKTITLKTGTLFVKRKSVLNNWEIKNIVKTNYHLSFFHIKKIKLPYDLSRIYLNIIYRIAFASKIKKSISPIHNISDCQKCFTNGIDGLSKYIKIQKLIGKGDWGNVYSAYIPSYGYKRKFAVKIARIEDEDYNEPYTDTSSAWYELWILKEIIRPLIKRNVCPNLPFFIDTFLCKKYEFVFRKENKICPCIVNIMELASCDMRHFLKFENPSDDELYSALFQIMAGLHSIQMSGQILNNDIKTTNILVYDVKPGGYWHYKIGEHNFYVPNYGKMFVINDFGVSTLYNPNYQLYPNKEKTTFNLGSRYAINIDGIFSPIESEINNSSKIIKWLDNDDIFTSKGITYKLNRQNGEVINSKTILTPSQKSYLLKKGITTNPNKWEFFEHPSVIPPFEFYNDVQDILRIFVGGKRTTQNGNHILYHSVSIKFQESIKYYMGESENSSKMEFSVNAYNVLAGEFIIKFFTETYSYKKRPKDKKIDYYDMNKCLFKQF